MSGRSLDMSGVISAASVIDAVIKASNAATSFLFCETSLSFAMLDLRMNYVYFIFPWHFHESSIPVCKASNGEVRRHCSRTHSKIERLRNPRVSRPRGPTRATAPHRPASLVHRHAQIVGDR